MPPRGAARLHRRAPSPPAAPFGAPRSPRASAPASLQDGKDNTWHSGAAARCAATDGDGSRHPLWGFRPGRPGWRSPTNFRRFSPLHGERVHLCSFKPRLLPHDPRNQSDSRHSDVVDRPGQPADCGTESDPQWGAPDEPRRAKDREADEDAERGEQRGQQQELFTLRPRFPPISRRLQP